MKKTHTTALLALASLAAFAAKAQPADPAALFSDYLQRSEGQSSNCASYLSRSWDSFGGTAGEYQRLEKEYLDGAVNASICGIRWGYSIYILLGELQKIRKAGVRDLQAAAREAEVRFDKMPMSVTEDFMSKVNCTASTPVIRYTGYFTQKVQVRCTTPKGPAAIDLTSMRIQIGGNDVWNGSGSFFGRSL